MKIMKIYAVKKSENFGKYGEQHLAPLLLAAPHLPYCSFGLELPRGADILLSSRFLLPKSGISTQKNRENGIRTQKNARKQVIFDQSLHFGQDLPRKLATLDHILLIGGIM